MIAAALADHRIRISTFLNVLILPPTNKHWIVILTPFVASLFRTHLVGFSLLRRGEEGDDTRCTREARKKLGTFGKLKVLVLKGGCAGASNE